MMMSSITWVVGYSLISMVSNFNFNEEIDALDEIWSKETLHGDRRQEATVRTLWGARNATMACLC